MTKSKEGKEAEADCDDGSVGLEALATLLSKW